MTSSRQPENDAQPNDDHSSAFKDAFEQLEDVLRTGFERTADDISPAETEQIRAKFTVHFEYREYSVTPDPNIMVPDDNELWFTLFQHFVARCDTWRVASNDPESIELLQPFASNQDRESPSSAVLTGPVDERFVECIMLNAQGAHGQIRWFYFAISSTETGFQFTTEHNGTEFIVATNDPDDVDYLKETISSSMRLNIWPLDDSA